MSSVKIDSKLLSSLEVIRELRRRGYRLSRTSLMRYVEKGYIPKEFIIIEKKLKRKLHYFKPEVVDFLVEKLSGD